MEGASLHCQRLETVTMKIYPRLMLSSGIVATLMIVPLFLFADVEDGLVGYYPMEGKDKVLKDVSGRENDGQIFTAKRTRDGKFGAGLFFDARSKSAVIHKTEGLQVEDGFAVAFWVKLTEVDLVGESRAIYKHGQYNIDLLHGAGRIEIRTDGAWKGTGPGERLILDEWYHIVGTLVKGTATYYKNSFQMGNVGGLGKIQQTNSRIQIGDMGLKPFVGVMDELRIYNRGFKPKEVRELFELEPRRPQSISPLYSLTTQWARIKRYR